MNILGEIPQNGYNPARVALDPNDPDYLKKLGLIGAVEGHHELNASNTQPEDQNTTPSKSLGNPAEEKPIVKPMSKFDVGTPPQMGPLVGAPPAAPEGAIPQSGANPNEMAMPQEKPAINRLWDKASAIQNPALRTLGRIGTGVLGGAEAFGEALAPTVARNIPGSMTHANVENAINFERQQEALKTRTEQEREQEEQDWHQQMANVAQQKANTSATQGQEKIDLTADQQKFQRDIDTAKQTLAENSEKFREHLGQGRLDQAADSLAERADQFNRLFPLKEQQLGTQEQRTEIAQEEEGIKADAEELAREMFATTDAAKRADLAAKIVSEGPTKVGAGYLFTPAVLQAAMTYATGAAQPTKTPVTPLNNPHPAGNEGNAGKQAISKDTLEQYAKKHKMTTDAASKFLTSKGYVIQ